MTKEKKHEKKRVLYGLIGYFYGLSDFNGMKKEKIGLYGLVGSNNSANYMAKFNSYVK